MIRESIEPGTKVFHEQHGVGTFHGFETKEGNYKGFALVEFDIYGYLGRCFISRRNLTEIETE